ncbi:MAG: molybdopterin-dependent oxidoreductase [Candidatus Dormibacteria bacterium]
MSTPDLPAAAMGRGRRRWLAGGVKGNRRLTAATGVTMHTLLWVQVVSAVIFLLMSVNVVLPTGPLHAVIRPVHFFVGFLLMPLVAIKLASTGYKFAQYYLLRSRTYHEAGPPGTLARLIAPLMVLSILVLFVTGWEMWSFKNQLGFAYIPLHVFASIVFLGALTVHIILHVREAHDETAAELSSAAAPADEPVSEEDWAAGRLTRRALLGTGLASGAVLAFSTAQFPVAVSWLSPKRAGSKALDFPVMNYEGAAQRVDINRWRLAVDGEPGLVTHPLSLSFDEVMAMPTEEHEYSIDCVTGWTATRRWRGVPIRQLLARAGTSPDFGHVLIRSTSGYHWSHDRSRVLLAGALLVTHINGEKLSDDHGYPLRLMIPGVQGQQNIKWVDGLMVRRGAPETYDAANFTYNTKISVTGKTFKANPAGKRQ